MCSSKFFSFNMFEPHVGRVFQNRFSTQYRCYSVSMLAGPNDRSDVEKGGKIIMPPSALDQLSIGFANLLILIIFSCLQDDTASNFIAFSGEGQSLRKKDRKP
uniref:Ubiquitin fusion degradation protein 1 homolog n=1 Tax=Sinocyclocheilus anshuiensis TaxID=1608454 RepID=A0A671RLB8_9TELE